MMMKIEKNLFENGKQTYFYFGDKHLIPDETDMYNVASARFKS